jgi:hypothetical protein
MKLELASTADRVTLGVLYVDRREALALISSLTNQLIDGCPNGRRLESRCHGGADEFTIAVTE